MNAAIWHGTVTPADLNDRARGCLNETLGIEILEIADSGLRGRMPVDARTTQPAGMLHGGASVAFAETLASWAGYLAVDRERFHVVGLEINANHVRAVPAGAWVFGEATPQHVGRRVHVWQIRIIDGEDRLVCVSRCTLAVLDQASEYAPPEVRARRA
jgi:uncharacterized protein (TIGR00369 family)